MTQIRSQCKLLLLFVLPVVLQLLSFVNSTSLPLPLQVVVSSVSKNNNDNNSIVQQQQKQRKSISRRRNLSMWKKNTNNVLLVSTTVGISGGTSSGSEIVPVTTLSNNVNNNPIQTLVSYMKDSITSTITGTTNLYKNHIRCNTIRKQQLDYKNSIINQWIQQEQQQEQQKQNTESIDIKKLKIEYTKKYDSLKMYNTGGGGNITYEDYIFLQNGKIDRGKVFNLVFLMWGAPKFLPYALLFNKDLLPSTFKSTSSSLSTNTNTNVNIRSCIVLRTLMELELETMKNRNIQQQQSSSSPFNVLSLFSNKNKVLEQQKLTNTVYQSTQNLLSSSSSSSSLLSNNNNNNNNNNNRNKVSNTKQSTIQPSSIMATMAPYIYRVSNPNPSTSLTSSLVASTDNNVKSEQTITSPPVFDFTKSEKALCTVPKCVVKGLVDAIACSGVNGGGSTVSSVFNGGGIVSLLQPYFLKRQNLVKHIQKIILCDEFLIYNNINLNTISNSLLIDTCNDRLIYPPSVHGLQQWLHYTVQQPLLIQQRLNNNNNNNAATTTTNPSITTTPPNIDTTTTIQNNKRELFYNSAVARVALMSYYACQSIRNTVLYPPSSSSTSSNTNDNSEQQQPCVVLPRLLLSSSSSSTFKPTSSPSSPAS